MQRRAHAVRSAGAGRVRFRGIKGGYGMSWRSSIRAGHPLGHLSRFGKASRFGTSRRTSELIGYCRKPGLATGPHLHFGISSVACLDPQVAASQSEPGPPIADSIRADFLTQTTPLLARLDGPALNSATAVAAR